MQLNGPIQDNFGGLVLVATGILFANEWPYLAAGIAILWDREVDINDLRRGSSSRNRRKESCNKNLEMHIDRCRNSCITENRIEDMVKSDVIM